MTDWMFLEWLIYFTVFSLGLYSTGVELNPLLWTTIVFNS